MSNEENFKDVTAAILLLVTILERVHFGDNQTFYQFEQMRKRLTDLQTKGGE